MVAKDKAKELVDKYYLNCDSNYSESCTLYNSKQCALICVNEITKYVQMPIVIPYLYSFEYWQKVKEEINKL
jgi:hypothetical protein